MSKGYRIHDGQSLYFLTCTVHQWVDVFSRSCYSDIIVDSLRYCQQHKGLHIFSWVVMSNHLHLIAGCTGEHHLSDVLRDFKKYTATKVVDAIKENKVESRRSWLLWLFCPDGAVRFWQPDNRPKEIISRQFFVTARPSTYS